jgi:hypothetical protein
LLFRAEKEIHPLNEPEGEGATLTNKRARHKPSELVLVELGFPAQAAGKSDCRPIACGEREGYRGKGFAERLGIRENQSPRRK